MDDGRQQLDEGFIDDSDEQTMVLVLDVFTQQDGRGDESQSSTCQDFGMDQMEGPSIEVFKMEDSNKPIT